MAKWVSDFVHSGLDRHETALTSWGLRRLSVHARIMRQHLDESAFGYVIHASRERTVLFGVCSGTNT
jgi:hypothetical protein